MEIIVWIIFGGIAGWIASTIVTTDSSQTILGDVSVGIIGALVGGFAMSIFGQTSFSSLSLPSLLVATTSAVIVLFTYKTITDQV